MQHYTLTKHTDNTTIFFGHYPSFIKCLEDAVEQQINLEYVNLQSQNLTNANLDGANMPSANMNGTNLTGANLSESNLKETILTNTSLYNTCFAYSDLRNSDFRNASFGATMIEGCNMRNCLFSTLSCFDLDFTLTQDISGSLYAAPNGQLYKMSKHPIVLKGLLNNPVIVLDQAIKIGEKILPKETLPTLIQILKNYTKPVIDNSFKPQIEQKGEYKQI